MANLTGRGAPTANTVGAAGDIYTNELSGVKYKCTGVVGIYAYGDDDITYCWSVIPEENSGGGGGGSNVLVVTVTEFEGEEICDTTYADMCAALKENKAIFCLYRSDPDLANNQTVMPLYNKSDIAAEGLEFKFKSTTVNVRDTYMAVRNKYITIDQYNTCTISYENREYEMTLRDATGT